MTAKAATVRLYVTVVSLLTAIVALLGAFVELATALIRRLTTAATSRAQESAADAGTSVPKAPRTPLRLVKDTAAATAAKVSPNAERLTIALTGLGFRAPDVRRFTSSLGERIEHEPIETLIKDGLRVLAPSAGVATRAC